MNLFPLLLLAIIFASNANPIKSARYPQEALQCYSSSALSSQKDGAIICPQDRQAFCIKEVINATSRGDCGSVEGIYYGRDVWDRKLAQCVYRKCSATCPSEEDDQKRIFGGEEESLSSIGALTLPKLVFNRTSYCCEDNLCNAGDRSMLVSVGVIGIALAVNAIVE